MRISLLTSLRLWRAMSLDQNKTRCLEKKARLFCPQALCTIASPSTALAPSTATSQARMEAGLFYSFLAFLLPEEEEADLPALWDKEDLL